MAFQVLGDTVIDQNQIITSPKLILEGTSASESILSGSLNGDSKLEIKADGSAEFASGAAKFKSTGELQIDRTNAANTLLGFYLNGSNTGFVRADGSATFKGTVTADSTTSTNGVFNGSLNGTITSYVLANGAAAFAGGNGVTTNQSFGIDQYGRVSIREDASGLTDVFAILKGSSTTKTCTISNDGTVTAGLFAATGVNNTGVEAGSGGLLSVQRGPSSGTSDVFRGYQGATVNTRIRANGSAEFAGTVDVGGLTVGGSSVDTSAQVDAKIAAIPATDLSNYDTSTEVTNKINTLLGGAPAALDTLNELAAAIGDDANFAATITGQLANKVDSSTLSSYPKIDGTNNVITSAFNITYNSGVTGSSKPGYSHAAIEIQTSGNHVPAISFHRGGYSAVTLYENGNQLLIKPNSTNSQEGLILSTGNIGSYAWTSSNDGSGSGLDADKLDGQEGSFYRDASNINAGTFPDRFSSTSRYSIGLINGNGYNSYDKIRVWDSSSYTIGMHSGQTFGWLNDYAMTFTMNNESDRGFLWRDTSDSSAQGAMSLTTNGNLCVGNAIAVGGQTTRYLAEPNGQYGSIQINGAGYNNWEGFSIDGRAVFMHNGDIATGIYNDVNNQWLFYAIHNGYSAMYHAGSECIKTTGSSSATIGGNTIVHTAGTGLSQSGSTVSLNINGLPAL